MDQPKELVLSFPRPDGSRLEVTVEGEFAFSFETLIDEAGHIFSSRTTLASEPLKDSAIQYLMKVSSLLRFGSPNGSQLGDAVELIGDCASVALEVSFELMGRAAKLIQADPQAAALDIERARLITNVSRGLFFFPHDANDPEQVKARGQEWRSKNPAYDLPQRISKAVGREIKRRDRVAAIERANKKNALKKRQREEIYDHFKKAGYSSVSEAVVPIYGFFRDRDGPNTGPAKRTIQKWLYADLKADGIPPPTNKGRRAKSPAK